MTQQSEITRYCFASEGMSDPPVRHESTTGDVVDYWDHLEAAKELIDRIAMLEAAAVKESLTLAQERLRADQMTQRLDMANRLGNDARAELAQLRQAGATEWIDPTDKSRKQYLPHIGERVLFKHNSRVYTGQHTGASFKADFPLGKHFVTWDCEWIYPSALLAASPTPPAQASKPVPLTDAQCDKLIAALCPDFTDERFPRDRPIMRQLARDAITPTT